MADRLDSVVSPTPVQEFAAKVKRAGTGPMRIAIRGQACTETSCKNIDAAISLAPGDAKAEGEPEINLKNLIQVR